MRRSYSAGRAVDPADVAGLGDLPQRRRVAGGPGVAAVELLAVRRVRGGDQQQRLRRPARARSFRFAGGAWLDDTATAMRS